MGRAPGSIDREKQEAVLRAAAAGHADRGAGATVMEISRRSGVTRQTVYNHFGGRDGLFAAAARRIMIDDWPPGPSSTAAAPDAALADYAAALLTWLHRPQTVVALRAFHRGFAGLGLAPLSWTTGAVDALAGFFSQEASRGRLDAPEPRSAAALFLDLVLAAPQLRILQDEAPAPSAWEIEVRSHRCAQLFIRGCARAPAGGTGLSRPVVRLPAATPVPLA
jgi:AcrR family transcriptional regulator